MIPDSQLDRNHPCTPNSKTTSTSTATATALKNRKKVPGNLLQKQANLSFFYYHEEWDV